MVEEVGAAGGDFARAATVGEPGVETHELDVLLFAEEGRVPEFGAGLPVVGVEELGGGDDGFEGGDMDAGVCAFGDDATAGVQRVGGVGRVAAEHPFGGGLEVGEGGGGAVVGSVEKRGVVQEAEEGLEHDGHGVDESGLQG